MDYCRRGGPLGHARFVVCLIAAAGAAPLAADDGGAAPTDFQPYTETIAGTDVEFRMVPIPGGTFLMGSPEDEEGREEIEGPQTEVTISPFWMGAHEVTWQEFDVFAFSYDVKRAKEAAAAGKPLERTEWDLRADAVTRPTPPYVDMTFGYGHDGFPAICMTAHAARQYCQWLSEKTGKTYRLPTEAEWEYACRAGTKGPWFFGDDAGQLDEYAWYYENSNEKPQPVGKKKPNPWGLYDILGNVQEWCEDKFVENYFERLADSKMFADPVIRTDETVWHAVRGGSWEDDPEFVRAAARRGAEENWSVQDPQEPKSIWWHTDAHWVGIRVVRPYEPKKE